MNMFKRGMVFVTFFLSCLIIALLVAALSTKYWIVSRAKRISNSEKSDGRINFGLFEGKKELNVGYGWRTYEIKMLELPHTDREFLIYGVWVATIGCLCAGVLFGALAAIFAVVNTATTPSGSLSGVPGLYIWNFFSLFFNLAAVSLWIIQYYQKFQYNVMSMEDQQIKWSSAGMTKFGHSFWFVVGASIASFANVIIIYVGTSEGRQKKIPQPMIEEKSNGAIMLY